MNDSGLIDIFRFGNISIPLYFYRNIKDLGLDKNEFFFLMYLYNQGEKFLFDPVKFEMDLNMEVKEVMELISSLTTKDVISILVLKNAKGISEEYVSMEGFYRKVSSIIKNEVTNTNVVDKSNIYEKVEKEFGRTLSPVEYEIIKAWLSNGVSEELIEVALGDAVYNGVSNLRYIDKILFEYSKKGYRTKEDVVKNKLVRKEEDVELFNYNWLDDDE